MRLNAIDWLAIVLVVIGALNWGLVALFQVDLVQALVGSIPALATVVYLLVALAGLWMIYLATRLAPRTQS